MRVEAPSDEAQELERELEQKGFQRNFRIKSIDGKDYTFHFWNPKSQLLVEIYPRKPLDQIRISPEYDQLYFLVELHIKLIHREFHGLKIAEAIAVGDFSPRAQEYARVHGGMKLFPPSEAPAWVRTL